MIYKVVISRNVHKQINKVPRNVVAKLMLWVDSVEKDGLEVVRKIPGFHDEPLKGTRKGQRSIRLNRAYRAIYSVGGNKIEFVYIKEVGKHGY